ADPAIRPVEPHQLPGAESTLVEGDGAGAGVHHQIGRHGMVAFGNWSHHLALLSLLAKRGWRASVTLQVTEWWRPAESPLTFSPPYVCASAARSASAPAGTWSSRRNCGERKSTPSLMREMLHRRLGLPASSRRTSPRVSSPSFRGLRRSCTSGIPE